MGALSALRAWKRAGRVLAAARVRACMGLAIAIAAAFGANASAQSSDAARAADRRAMVEDIRDEHPAIPIDRRVLDAIGRVPRHAFVPPSQATFAYENRPLPIGCGQTISQPYIVALMTQLAAPEATHRVLEIGTGSGYQAAVLALLARDVYTIEIIEPLAATAKDRLRTYANVRTRVGDGYYGWKEAGPFDAIVVTAAADSVPPPLIAQLKPGGRMVIPVGTSFFTQRLLLVTKDAKGRVRTRSVLPVRFVPLTGDH